MSQPDDLRGPTSVRMVVGISLVAGMRMLMNAVFSWVPMVVATRFRIVQVFVRMPVLVVVSVSMGVLVRMCLAIVSMLMGMEMLVLVNVNMVVFVRSLHVGLLLCDRIRRIYLWSYFNPSGAKGQELSLIVYL
jgi:hypothetical protein